MKQLPMFTTEDLPLFSGTAPRGDANPFETSEEPQQATLPTIHCAFCMDTGRVRTSLSPTGRRTNCSGASHTWCWCEAGQAAKVAYQNKEVVK